MHPRLTLLLLCALIVAGLRAQWTPAANATQMQDSLVFVASAINNPSLVWHPVLQRYYSVRMGGTNFPLETWLPSGGLSVAQTTCGIDTRGMWYNPNTGQMERNCFAASGWATLDTDASGNALSTFTQLFMGTNQPNAQSVGAYDPTTDQVIFYFNSVFHFYARATATLVSTLPATGYTPMTNVVQHVVMYTGQAGYELCLYDAVAKRAVLFNKATGAFSGSSDLPASAVATTTAAFRVSYTNNRFWLFNSTLRKWNAYCIWNQPCPSTTLPVELVQLEAACNGMAVELEWATGSERNSQHFEVQRSTDAGTWNTVGQLPAAGESTQHTTYAYRDTDPPPGSTCYYRLRQVDQDGSVAHYGPVAIVACAAEDARLSAFPNPSSGAVELRLSVTSDAPVTITLHDALGRTVSAQRSTPQSGVLQHRMDMNELPNGTYHTVVRAEDGTVLGRTVVIKQQ